MSDPEFTRLLRQTARAYNRYLPMLKRAQEEYQRRYGHLPGDVDDDYWIDSLEGGCGAADERITAEKVEQAARPRV